MLCDWETTAGAIRRVTEMLLGKPLVQKNYKDTRWGCEEVLESIQSRKHIESGVKTKAC